MPDWLWQIDESLRGEQRDRGPAHPIFTRDEHGRRPVYGGTEKFQSDPLWRDHILFNEYFHGDNGAGLGASHQTGWTGLVAKLIHVFGRMDAEQYLAAGKKGLFAAAATGRG